jgi:hypothetical protein
MLAFTRFGKTKIRVKGVKEVSRVFTIINQSSKKGLRKIVYIIIVCFLLVGMKSTILYARDSNSLQWHHAQKIPLLLNSKQVTDNKAIVKVVIWFEDSVDFPYQIPKFPLKNWNWSYKYLQAGNSKKAVTISGECFLDKEEELQVYAWYTKTAPIIERKGGKVFLDERISESLDVSAYLDQVHATPVEWSLADNLVSIAASQQQINTCVKAGNDTINMQMLSRGQGKNGQTLLAIPVLLEEF